MKAVLVLVAAPVALGGVAGACDRSEDGGRAATRTTTTVAAHPAPGEGADERAVEVTVGDHPRGGSARVGVWATPDPASPTLGGAAVRALVLPQLFVARPNGKWSPALVEPGSDRTAADAMSGSFRLRAGATWSDGSPITAADLERSRDGRFVAGVEAATDGSITVRFTSRLPNWRRLWSGAESIAAPGPNVWGGPFVVSSVTPGLETVLARNDRWWGKEGPFLDEVRLVLVPDATTSRQLLAAGQLDVVMPLAATVRTEQLSRIPGVSVDRVQQGGWSVDLVANPAAVSIEKRRALIASFDRAAFVSTLLAGEATPLQGFAGAEDATWAPVAGGDLDALKDQTVDLVGATEEPMTALVHRSMQKRVRAVDGTVELRAAEADRVEGWLASGAYEAGVAVWLDPLGGCWTCRWSTVGNDGLPARAADGGDPAAISSLETTLRDDALVLPLWRPTTVVAWRDGLNGVRANGYAASGAWNTWEWWRSGA